MTQNIARSRNTLSTATAASAGARLNAIPAPIEVKPETVRIARILLVDDDFMALVLLAKGLREMGYEVDEAPNAQIALKHIESKSYDLGIFDICMPGMSGIELAAEVHRSTRLPVLFLSANSDRDTVSQAKAESPIGYLVKPVSAPNLFPSIEAALASARSMEKNIEACAHLTDALEKKRVISTAVGVLLARTHSHREAASRALRKLARDNHRKIEDVAESIVNAAETLHSAEASLRTT